MEPDVVDSEWRTAELAEPEEPLRQPGRAGPRRPAAATVAPLLHDLFGVGLIFCNAEGNTKDTLAVACDKQAVSVFLSGQNRPDERVVVIPHSAH